MPFLYHISKWTEMERRDRKKRKKIERKNIDIKRQIFGENEVEVKWKNDEVESKE